MTEAVARVIKERNIVAIYTLTIFTFGIYGLVWAVKSKRDMNALGAEIPTSWLAAIPFVGVYWMYKYCEGFSEHIKKDNNTMMWFAIYAFAGIVMPYIVQTELNNFANKDQSNQHQAKLAA